MEVRDRTFVVTGANTGIGRVTAHQLASLGAHVILACRSEDKTLPVVEEIREATGNSRVEFTPLDLTDFDSVHACADRLLEAETSIAGLINNAGIAGPRGQTKQGFELHFGVNHLAHFLLTLRLIGAVKAAAPSRIVNLSSKSNYDVKHFDLDAVQRSTRSMTGLPEYGVSKLANVLFTRTLAKRLVGTGVTTYSLHPGVVASDIWRRVPPVTRWIMKRFMIDTEAGARTTLHCATSDEVATESGLYYDKCKPQDPNPLGLDDDLAEGLWRRSLEWTGVQDPF